MKKNKYITFFTPSLIVLFIVFGVILYPSESINSAKEGLRIWSQILVPSLLPFIIGASLIVELKIVDIVGLIINPITRLIFNVSGKSALVFVISTVSGYPVGAKLASELRANNQITRTEAQRLVSFCSTSGPLFIIGAVATGMFQNTNLGYLMLLCHYLGSISVGLLYRNFGKEIIHISDKNLKSNISNAIDSRILSDKGFFVLFGNAVYNGVNTLLVVGGFVIIFSVVFRILSLFNVISFFTSLLYLPLSFLGVSRDLCSAFISGLFEITIGCNKIASVSSAPEVLKATLASFLIGFSGLSILAQCCNFIAKTDISTGLYIFSKFLHGFFSSLFTFLFYPLLKSSSLVSNFSNLYIVFYDNLLWNYYISHFKLILPLFIIVYIFIALFILERASHNINKNI